MAKDLRFELPHTFSSDDALARMQALGSYYANKYDAQVSWQGSSGRIKAKYMLFEIDCELEVTTDKIRAVGKDPGALLRKKALRYLTGKVTAYLDPSVTVEQLPRS